MISGQTITGGVGANGGGIDDSGTLTVTNTAISGNWASGFGGAMGGGILNESSGAPTISDSTINGNTGGHVGGIAGAVTTPRT